MKYWFDESEKILSEKNFKWKKFWFEFKKNEKNLPA